MTVYVTGDVHGEIEVRRLSVRNFLNSILACPGHGDLVVVLGDFGLVWSNPRTKTEDYWIRWLKDKPFEVAFVRGNHENHDMLDALPTMEKWGSPVGVVCDNVYELKTGHIYTIEDQKYFIFGGAESRDRSSRMFGVSWWPGEIPSMAQFNLAWDNLDEHCKEVDFVLSHTAPKNIIQTPYSDYSSDPTCQMLQSFHDGIQFKEWYCGHLHINQSFDNFHILYDHIKRVN